jgi:hypothetical protein
MFHVWIARRLGRRFGYGTTAIAMALILVAGLVVGQVWGALTSPSGNGQALATAALAYVPPSPQPRLSFAPYVPVVTVSAAPPRYDPFHDLPSPTPVTTVEPSTASLGDTASVDATLRSMGLNPSRSGEGLGDGDRWALALVPGGGIVQVLGNPVVKVVFLRLSVGSPRSSRAFVVWAIAFLRDEGIRSSSLERSLAEDVTSRLVAGKPVDASFQVGEVTINVSWPPPPSKPQPKPGHIFVPPLPTPAPSLWIVIAVRGHQDDTRFMTLSP